MMVILVMVLVVVKMVLYDDNGAVHIVNESGMKVCTKVVMMKMIMMVDENW